MSTFKEIDINEYKKLLDNMQHTYAKTFNNIELLHNFEKNVNNKNVDSIIKDKEMLEKEDQYINKLSDKLSEKISNSNIVKNNNIIQHDDNEKYLNPYQYYNENPGIILNYIKDLYIKSDIAYKDIYKPKKKTKIVALSGIIRSIKENDDIPNNLREPLIEAYDNIANKTNIKYSKEDYEKYVFDAIMDIYNNKDDDRSQKIQKKVNNQKKLNNQKQAVNKIHL